MSDINLLPEELRGKEVKEQAAVKKLPKIAEVKLAQPAPEPKKSFFGRLFFKNKKNSK